MDTEGLEFATEINNRRRSGIPYGDVVRKISKMGDCRPISFFKAIYDATGVRPLNSRGLLRAFAYKMLHPDSDKKSLIEGFLYCRAFLEQMMQVESPYAPVYETENLIKMNVIREYASDPSYSEVTSMKDHYAIFLDRNYSAYFLLVLDLEELSFKSMGDIGAISKLFLRDSETKDLFFECLLDDQRFSKEIAKKAVEAHPSLLDLVPSLYSVFRKIFQVFQAMAASLESDARTVHDSIYDINQFAQLIDTSVTKFVFYKAEENALISPLSSIALHCLPVDTIENIIGDSPDVEIVDEELFLLVMVAVRHSRYLAGIKNLIIKMTVNKGPTATLCLLRQLENFQEIQSLGSRSRDNIDFSKILEDSRFSKDYIDYFLDELVNSDGISKILFDYSNDDKGLFLAALVLLSHSRKSLSEESRKALDPVYSRILESIGRYAESLSHSFSKFVLEAITAEFKTCRQKDDETFMSWYYENSIFIDRVGSLHKIRRYCSERVDLIMSDHDLDDF